MKRARSFVRSLLALALAAGCIGCETASHDQRHKKKVVTAEEFDSRQENLSGLPWNRPRAFESNSGMGRMMPQSR
jgi:hypothetical protein